jgi:hypothetical protein
MGERVKDEIVFTGRCNSDVEDRKMPRGDVRYFLNCSVSAVEGKNIAAVVNKKGNELISLTMPTGNNMTIGSCFDSQNNAVFYFVYNDTGKHCILRYYADNNSIEKILWEESVLNFQKTKKIHSANALDGMLYWTDGYDATTPLNWINCYNPPRKINVDKAKRFTSSGGTDPLGYDVLDEIVLDAAKYPPLYPPAISTIGITGEASGSRNVLLSFFYRWIYDDNEKSVYSPLSKEDPMSGARITVNTGPSIVKRIEIGVRVNNTFKKIASLEKYNKAFGVLIASNTTTYYDWEGDTYLGEIPAEEALLQYHAIPQVADTQEIVNDNAMCYGNGTEGYNNEEIDITLAARALATNDPSIAVGNTRTWKRNGAYQLGIVYLDAAGRSGAVNTSGDNIFNVPWYRQAALDTANYNALDPWIRTTNQVIRLDWEINHQPPLWAVAYKWVVSKDQVHKTYECFRARGSSAIDNDILQMPDDYVFNQGDKIRIIAKYNSTYFSSFGYEFELNAFVAADEAFIESFDTATREAVLDSSLLTDMVANPNIDFIIQVYQRNDSESNSVLFYDIGEVYEIIDPHTAARQHAGPTQDQAGVGTPAKGTIDGFECFLSSTDSETSDVKVAVDIVRTGTLGGGTPLIGFIADGDQTSVFNIGDQISGENFIGLPQYNGLFTIAAIAYDAGADETCWQVSELSTILSGTYSGAAIYKLVKIDYGAIAESMEFGYKFTGSHSDAGKVYVEDPDHKRQKLTFVRHSQKYFTGTNKNGLNDFRFNGYQEFSPQFGPITRIIEVGNVLKVLQWFKNTSVDLGRETITNPDGTTQMILSNKLLGTKRVSEDNFGCQHPESVVKYDRNIYFYDVNRGKVVRDAPNGMFPISDFMMEAEFQSITDTVRSLGTRPVFVYGTADEKAGEVIFSWNGDDGKGGTMAITWAFNEKENGWKSKYSFVPEFYGRIGNVLVSFKNGELWRHNSNNVDRCSFYGVKYPQQVRFVSNIDLLKAKVWQNIAVYSNKVWHTPDNGIVIPATDDYPNGMVSRLKANKFKHKQTIFYADFMRDINTPNLTNPLTAIVNGRKLMGQVLDITLENNHDDEVVLFEVIVEADGQEKSK